MGSGSVASGDACRSRETQKAIDPWEQNTSANDVRAANDAGNTGYHATGYHTTRYHTTGYYTTGYHTTGNAEHQATEAVALSRPPQCHEDRDDRDDREEHHGRIGGVEIALENRGVKTREPRAVVLMIEDGVLWDLA